MLQKDLVNVFPLTERVSRLILSRPIYVLSDSLMMQKLPVITRRSLMQFLQFQFGTILVTLKGILKRSRQVRYI